LVGRAAWRLSFGDSEAQFAAVRTQEPTKDVLQMIERLQIGVQSAVKATHSGSARARQSVEQAAGPAGGPFPCLSD
jgi:hypothetical protein